MKKIFQSALSFIVAATMLAGNCFAQAAQNSQDNFSNSPTVTVGGFINTDGGVRGESGDYKDSRLPDAVICDGISTSNGCTTTDKGQIAPGAPGTQNRMSNNPDFANDSEIFIKAGGINELGMKYGAVVQLEADVSTDATRQGFNASRSFIFTESNVGKVEFGNNIGANQKMKVGPTNFARAAGGINGKYLEYINLPMLADTTQTGVTSIGGCTGFRVAPDGTVTNDGTCNNVKLPRFILIPTSPVSHGGYARGFYNRTTDNDYSTSSYNNGSFNNGSTRNGNTTLNHNDGSFGQLENATKVSYYIPRIAGWQLGASFTPDTGNRGSSASFTGDNSGDMKNVFSWGVNYSDNFDNLGLAFSATGERGSFEQDASATVKRNDLNAYEIGAMMTFFGFTLGGSYGSWGKSLQPKSGIYSCDYNSTQTLANQNCTGANAGKKFDDSTYYTAGAAYQFGPIAASLTYMRSEFQKNQYDATSFGVDYKMAKGLMPYIEVTQFKFTSNQSTALGANQADLTSSQRQIKDNKGYVALAGILLAF